MHRRCTSAFMIPQTAVFTAPMLMPGIVQQKEAITDFMPLDGGLAVLTNDNYLAYQ